VGTVVVAAYSADELKARETLAASSGRGEKADRRRRVAASKARAAADTSTDASDTAASDSEATSNEETK
jgi:hypothetical protein